MSDQQKRRKNILAKVISVPATLGITIGILAAAFQAVFGSAGGPEAYGFCVACHTRDLANTLANSFFPEGTVNLFVAIPVLTPIGVLIGAFISAKRHKEFRIKKSNIWTYLLYFLGGLVVMWFGLFLGACPYRAALRFAYGDLIALIGIGSIFLGVAFGTLIIFLKMRREVV